MILESESDISKAIDLLKALMHCIARSGAFDDTQLADVNFILTSDKDILGVPGEKDKIYLGAVNLKRRIRKDDDEKTVYLAHGFFRQSRKEQIKILHFLIEGKLAKGHTTHKAMVEAEKFVEKYYQ